MIRVWPFKTMLILLELSLFFCWILLFRQPGCSQKFNVTLTGSGAKKTLWHDHNRNITSVADIKAEWPRLLTGSGSDSFSPGDQDQREQNCWQLRLQRTRQTRFRGSEAVIRWDEANSVSSAVTYSVAPNSAGGAWLVSWPLGKSCELRPRPFLPSDPADGSELWPLSTSKSPSVTLSEPEADGKLSGRRWSETRGGKPSHLTRTTMGFLKAGTGNTGIIGHWS